MLKEFSGWQYGIDENGEMVARPLVNPKPKPNTLFKYLSLSQRTLDLLGSLQLYASYPHVMNDPIDSSYDLVKTKSINTLMAIYQGLYSKVEVEEILNKRGEKFFQDSIYSYFIALYKKYGILSLTVEANNPLLWAYYSDHKGLCVEYDYTNFPFDFWGPFEVRYTDEFEPIFIEESSGEIALLYQATTKASYWSHENEWRIFPHYKGTEHMELPLINEAHMDGDIPRTFKLARNAIKSITLGSKFFNYDSEFIRNGDRLIFEIENMDDIRIRLINILLELNVDLYYSLNPKYTFRFERARIRLEVNFEERLFEIIQID